MGNQNTIISSKSINKNSMLNVFICNSSSEIKNLKFIEKKRDNNKDQDYLLYKHKFYNWTFYDYGTITKKKLKKIRKKVRNMAKEKNFQNLILCFVPLNFTEDLKVIKIFAEKPDFTEKISSDYYQPLLLFINYSESKNTKYYRNKLLKLIDKEKNKYKMDELNITSFLYNSENFANELINELWKVTIYYNQLYSAILPMSESDNKLELKFEQNNSTFNILLAGDSGTGKSTFINIFNDRKTAYSCDSGLNKSNIINEYLIIHKGKIKINKEYKEIKTAYKVIDTCGFSLDNKEAKDLLQYIKDYQKESLMNKDKINVVFYFINEAEKQRFLTSNIEKQFFDFIYQEKMRIFFIINFCKVDNHDCKEKIVTMINDKFRNNYNFFIEEDLSNIIEVNLKERDGIKPFGLNKLMKKLKTAFEPMKIPINKLKELDNNILETPLGNKSDKNIKFEEGLKIMKESAFFNDLKTVDDLYKKCILNSKKLIYYSFPLLAGISFIPIPGLDDAIALTVESGLIISIGKCFGINMTKEQIKESFLSMNFGSPKRISLLVSKLALRAGGIIADVMKLAPPFGTIIGMAMSCGVNIASAKVVGEQAISFFLAKLIKEKNINYLFNISEDFNNNIDGFELIKNRFDENIY